MVVAAAVGAAAHRNHPLRVQHLIVDAPDGRCHLVRQRTGHDDHIGLAGTGTKDDAEAIHVVAGRGNVHHLHGAAGEAKGERPEGVLAAPIEQVVGPGEHVLRLAGGVHKGGVALSGDDGGGGGGILSRRLVNAVAAAGDAGSSQTGQLLSQKRVLAAELACDG